MPIITLWFQRRNFPVFPTVAMPWQMWPYLISSGHEFFSFMASHISPQKVQNVAIFDFAKFFGHIWAFSYKFWPFLANSYRFWKISFDFHLISKIRKILYWNFQKYNDLKMQLKVHFSVWSFSKNAICKNFFQFEIFAKIVT